MKTKEELENELELIQEELNMFGDILNQIESLKRKQDKIKTELEDFKPIHFNNAYVLTSDEIDETLSVELQIQNIFLNGEEYDTFRDEASDDLEYIEDGITIWESVFFVGSKLYSATFEFESEWHSEWSMRRNTLVGGKVSGIHEIKDFKITEPDDTWVSGFYYKNR